MYTNTNQTNKDFSKLPRSEKLYILSQVCINNMVTPETPGYVGLIIRVCTSKFAMSKEKAQEAADALKSAYEADQWTGLAQKHIPDEETTTEAETCTPRVFEETPKTLEVLNKLNYQSSTPIKRVEPQLAYAEPEFAPATIAKQLLQMAYNSDFNGVGRINLAEARYDLDDKTLTCQTIIQLLKQYNPKLDAEQRAGNNVLVYFDGKNNIKTGREIHREIQPATITLKPQVYYAPEAELEKDAVTADKTNNGTPTGPEPIDEGDDIPEVD